MPNISDKTGEFEYEGETKTMVDAMREKAGVQTFDQAVAIGKFDGRIRRRRTPQVGVLDADLAARQTEIICASRRARAD